MMLFWSCSSFLGWGQIGINTSTIWDNNNPPPAGYENGISITQGVNLEIYDLTLNFNSNAQISIGSNSYTNFNYSELIINNCTLNMGENSTIETRYTCNYRILINNSTLTSSGVVWGGVINDHIVNPHASCYGSQFITEPKINTDGSCNTEEWKGEYSPYGISLFLIENSKIENAETGIMVHKTTILNVRDSEFKNCKRGISIEQSVDSDQDISASYIMNSDFEWDDDLLFSGNDLVHIFLRSDKKNGAVRIGGCKFLNNRTNQSTWDNRGIGIKMDNASILLSRDGSKCCPDDGKCPDNCYPAPQQNRGNHFQYLGIGIDYESNIGNNFSCRFSEFDNCVFGIKIKDNTSNHSISRIGDNNFTIDKNTIETYFPTNYTSGNVIKLVHLEETADFGVYDNTFSHNLEYIACVTSKDPNLQYTNFIRKNTFTSSIAVAANCGPNVVAIDLYGNNDHLDITCNTFVNHVYDVKINEYADLNDIPNTDIHGSKFSANNWSKLPSPNFSFPPPLQNWLTNGCASNVWLDGGSGSYIRIYDKYTDFSGANKDNITFYPNVIDFVLNNPPGNNDDYLKSTRCEFNDVGCVDCSTDCDKLVNQSTALIGVDKAEREVYFNLFPNPSTEKTQMVINPQFYHNENKIIIYDFTGKIVASFNNVQATFEFNIKNHQISKGIYFVSYQTEGINSVKKLVVQ
jgi:hypothetical protein